MKEMCLGSRGSRSECETSPEGFRVGRRKLPLITSVASCARLPRVFEPHGGLTNATSLEYCKPTSAPAKANTMKRRYTCRSQLLARRHFGQSCKKACNSQTV